MIAFVLKRLAQLPVILLVIYTVTFVLAWALPGSAVINDEGRQPPAAVLEAMEAQYDLDDPVAFYTGYLSRVTGARWVRAQLDGSIDPPPYVFDFGPSFRYEDWSVNELLASTELDRLRTALRNVFHHLRKIRNTKYPLVRALRLVSVKRWQWRKKRAWTRPKHLRWLIGMANLLAS